MLAAEAATHKAQVIVCVGNKCVLVRCAQEACMFCQIATDSQAAPKCPVTRWRITCTWDRIVLSVLLRGLHLACLGILEGAQLLVAEFLVSQRSARIVYQVTKTIIHTGIFKLTKILINTVLVGVIEKELLIDAD